MKNQVEYTTNQADTKQGITKEQFKLAVSMIAGCLVGILMVSGVIGIYKLLKYIF
jgi:F0F1-type ATP synthase assembly protein I